MSAAAKAALLALRRLVVLRRARAELSRIFARIIQARRESKAKEEDMLQCFIDSRYEKVVPARSTLTNESWLQYSLSFCSSSASGMHVKDRLSMHAECVQSAYHFSELHPWRSAQEETVVF